jgi:integrase
VPFLKRKEDVAAVFAALPSSVNIVYALSALAGLRPGEAIALEWDAVDFESGTIRVRRRRRNGNLGVRKSGKDRMVPILRSLAAVLKAWRKRNPEAELVAPSTSASTVRSGRPRRTLFFTLGHRYNGRPRLAGWAPPRDRDLRRIILRAWDKGPQVPPSRW